MRSSLYALVASSGTFVSAASSLADVCTSAYVTAALPVNGTTAGITIDATSTTANAVYNSSFTGKTFYPDTIIDYCNVTFTYSHDGKEDSVIVQYWLPSPQNFKNRFLTTGGAAYAINQGINSADMAGGVMYGAAGGATDGGFGSFSTTFDEVFLLANGSINWDAVNLFGYQALGELNSIGLDLTANFFDTGDAKIYSYYQGFSEGGREGWSQIQKNGAQYDGVIPGSPAIRYGQQQAQHLYSNVVEQTLDYYPPSCEFDKIVNETITFCDPLDGRTDGVIARSDLCQLNLNLTSLIGLPYSCDASTATGIGLGYGKRKRQFPAMATTPAQNGTVTAEGIAVVQTIIDGLHDSNGKLAYISYQIGAEFEDAATTYNATTESWGLDISGAGGEWVGKMLELIDESNLPTLDNVTYDTLRDWMQEGWYRYNDSLQTNNPDLSTFQANGGKILAFHGEQDPSIPTGSSVHFHESVRNVMYPSLSYNDSTTAMGDWYRLFLIPGAAHCATNSLQPNAPFPQTNLQVLIDWVENNTLPTTLKATYPSGIYEGQDAQLCAWPLRPLYTLNGTVLECEYDQASIDTWIYDFNAYDRPLY